MTPIWMVYIVKYIPYRLEIWIVKTSAIFKPKVFLGWRLLSTFFSHRKCTHHSVSFHVGHRKISISHDDCSILHWLSNWNDFIALCGCIFVYLLLFFFSVLLIVERQQCHWLIVVRFSIYNDSVRPHILLTTFSSFFGKWKVIVVLIAVILMLLAKRIKRSIPLLRRSGKISLSSSSVTKTSFCLTVPLAFSVCFHHHWQTCDCCW